MKDLDGVQDVFCGQETIVYMKSCKDELAPDAIQRVFDDFEIDCDGIERDDSVVL